MAELEVVWVVFDYEEMVAVATSEARARRAAEELASAGIDKGHYGPAAAKRFQWNLVKGDLSIFCPRAHPFTGVVEDWHVTGLGVTAHPLLTDEERTDGR